MMSELIYKQQAIDAIYNTFSYAYCNNCENNGKDNDSCDECHRKYQNWAASRNTIESVINALPSASTELSNDSPKLDNKNGELISRQDAIKYFAELWECIEAISDREEWEDVCVTTVNEIKSAEPQKKGKWIFIHPLQADDEGAYICSNCHRGDWDIKPTDKYCKFCGMAMDIYATLLP